ncbi:MAG: PLP-dependent aminotransferase family protein [Roseobacter sp.]
MEFIINIDATKPLQIQFFDQIRAMILDGRLAAGVALPPTRNLAHRYGVSRNTVSLTYDRLVAEGYVEPRSTKGFFVAAIPPDDLLLIGRRVPPDNGPRPEEPPEAVLCFAGEPGGASDRPGLDFWVGRSASSSFPLSIWRRIVGRLLDRESQYLTDYCDPAGLPELRRAIAEYLGRSRGVLVSAEQIIVTSGGQEALSLVTELLGPQSDRLCIETPCYVGASMVFRAGDLEIDPVSVDGEGLRTDQLPVSKRNLIYVTPSHQFPTGATLPLNRRLALLRWAEETDSYIIEDDYDSDFHYDGPPLMALAGLDQGRRVFYVGTFSKSVGAGLRIGFAVVPRRYWSEARLLKARLSNGQSWLEQRALSEFLLEGHFDRHLRKLTKVYRARRDCLIAALTAHFGQVNLSGYEGGLHLVWHLPPDFPPAREIQMRARSEGVGVYALSSGAAYDFDESAPDRTLVLGYSSLDEKQITHAVEILSTITQHNSDLRTPTEFESCKVPERNQVSKR